MKFLELTYTLENILKVINKKLLKNEKRTYVSTEKLLSNFSKSLLLIKEIVKDLQRNTEKEKKIITFYKTKNN
ncbi:MAG: hypothetical protein ACO2OX_04695 [Candidatus Nanopusillus sp.]